MRTNRANLFTLLLILGAVALAAQFTVVLASPSPSPTPETSASPTASSTPVTQQALQSSSKPLISRPSFGRGIYPPASPYQRTPRPVVLQQSTP
jgi:hypothetical protein